MLALVLLAQLLTDQLLIRPLRVPSFPEWTQPGSGSRAPFINVRAAPFFAGSGGDDTVAIQAAVNARTPPFTVQFAGGQTYKINGTVSVPLGVSIDGNGAVLDVTGNTGVVFDFNPGGSVLSFIVPQTIFSGFRVNGDPANTLTRLVQTFRVPYFTMRDVTAFNVNVAKINGGNIITDFEQVMAYGLVGTVYWFTQGSDTFGPNFTSMRHVWTEHALNSGVIGVRIDAGDVRLLHSYFEDMPKFVWCNGGIFGAYDSSFNFREWVATGMQIDSVAGVTNPVITLSKNDFNFGESSSGSNTQTALSIATTASIVATGNHFDIFNSVNTSTTLFRTTSPNGSMFGTFTGNRVFIQPGSGYTQLVSVFDPTTVTGGIGYVTVGSNFFYGAAGATNAQIDLVKAGATGTLDQVVFSDNNFLRATNLIRLSNGKISGNNFQGIAPTITWASSGGILSDNDFGTTPTVTGAGRVFGNRGFDLGSGAITLAAGTGTATVWAGCRPICTDTTANASVKCAVAATTLTATGTGTDVIDYFCF